MVVADIPAAQGAVATQAWAAVDHAPMNRTARSRLNSRPHQGRRRPHHHQRPAVPLKMPNPRLRCSRRLCNVIPYWLVSQPASLDHISAICCSEQRTAWRVLTMPVSVSAKPTKPPGLQAPLGYFSSSCSWEPGRSFTSLKCGGHPRLIFQGSRGAVHSAAPRQSLPPQPYAPRRLPPRSPPLTRRPFSNC